MRLDQIKELIAASSGFRQVSQGVSERRYPVGVYGISDSARAAFISAFFHETDRNVYVFSWSDMEARAIYEDLQLWELEVYFLPSRELVFYDADAISGDLRWERLKVLKEIASDKKKIIVASVESLLSAWMPLDYFRRYTFRFRVGDVLELETLAKRLVESGYERSEITEGRGQFSLRGGIMDIFSPVASFPVRIELFGDEIETIRIFNPETQRSMDNVEETEIFPSKEIIIDKPSLIRGRDKIRAEFDDLTKNKAARKSLGTEAFEKLKAILAKNLESLDQTWSFETIDSYLPYFFEEPASLFDYIGDDFILLDDSVRTMGKLESAELEFHETYETFLGRGEILAGQSGIMVSPAEIRARLGTMHLLTINDMMKTDRILPPRHLATFEAGTIYHFHGQLEMLVDDIVHRKAAGWRTLILSATRPRGERLEKTLRDRDIEAIYRDDVGTLPESGAVITFGNQKKGFEFRDIKLAVISDAEVFGESSQKKKRRAVKGKGIEKIHSYDDLKKGEYVVHVNHGIGVYQGMKQMESQGAVKDYLEISYDRNDRLFIPVDQLDLIQKYIGNEAASPKVSRLGGQEWAKAKAKVRQNVDKVAEEIVQLYAQRSQVKGFEFAGDTPWQREFEDEFQFEETPDQITSIEEIKKDMESPRVMDRLLCGDVGYGKTEVAMRAAFKAVMDGKQVAVLVPTTILAEQHYKNFQRRFDGFAVNIDMISRFRTAAQVRDTLLRLKEGNVDIIIGTHKLLGKNVIFKDLGLLVIDEEQRFGVRHKEKLKELKATVDVLTLSATPIPRTLNMSMTGIRDISLIETPPDDRYPIQTYVVEFNEQLIRDAILREKGRHGQCYFVYNRVQDIDRMANYLKKLVPEAEFGIAHGQLSERELEDVMVEFMEGRFDVLVSSTIIETGLDISNVNTIIIYDSDKLGLSQLYQLRGRVGRTNRIAYAYLTYRRDKVLTVVAEKRLKALKDFTELGSGFRIAMRDLEIRGAGNMMGKAQSGHMAAVGYDLYIRMLDEAVKKLTGHEQGGAPETVVDIRLDAYIPREYISDEVLKIQMYKKIAAIETRDDYFHVKAELEDRFSDIPDATYNLMDVALLRAKAKALGVTEIRDRGSAVMITFVDREAIRSEYIAVISSREYAHRSQFYDKPAPQLEFRYQTSKERLIKDLGKLFDAMAVSSPLADSAREA